MRPAKARDSMDALIVIEPRSHELVRQYAGADEQSERPVRFDRLGASAATCV
jgi:hypothetical protein